MASYEEAKFAKRHSHSTAYLSIYPSNHLPPGEWLNGSPHSAVVALQEEIAIQRALLVSTHVAFKQHITIATIIFQL
ncbi:unnamed protein product [Gongylonema pulchrum]|uniref:Uncharacterized protein n=1 Tax=Gongylonema pulchrum TaxID=637853 RepID=A0A183CZ67_9BILA|nr:unnamed protein product [Gongylonema pulchrum]